MRATSSLLITAATALLSLPTAVALGGHEQQPPARIEFVRDVQPILRESCVGCHGPTQQMNGFRQLSDGSWFVRTRAIPIQPLFDAGFPHGPDAFISAAGTNWAALALTAGLSER